jgi:hypothetical protein
MSLRLSTFVVAIAAMPACVPSVTLLADAKDAAADRDADAPARDTSTDEAQPCEASPASGCPLITSGPSVFVVDSTSTLFSFDSFGALSVSVTIPTVSELVGAGIGYGDGTVFVTTGSPSVVAFRPNLRPLQFTLGAFPGLSVPRGIAYNCLNEALYVAGGSTVGVVVYNVGGFLDMHITGTFPNEDSPSGVAYDADDETIWVANDVAAPDAGALEAGVAEYTTNGNAADKPNYASQFTPPPHDAPYSIAVCTKKATGGQTLVIVGFIDDGSGLGSGVVQAYAVDGTKYGAPLPGPFTNPLGLSCTSTGRVYVADASGFYWVDWVGGVFEASDGGIAGAFGGLTPPILGVFAAN